jgi:hypothetical protein
LELALTLLDVAEQTSNNERKREHISQSRAALVLVENRLGAAELDEIERTEITIHLRVLEERLTGLANPL